MWRILLQRPVRCKVPTPNNRWNTSTRQESTQSSAIKADRSALKSGLKFDALRSRTANNAREAATIIVARNTEKNINSVVKSFECASNRPRRLIKLVTRSGIDIVWLNAWFALMRSDPSVPLYPIKVAEITGLDTSREALIKALIDVNKFYDILADQKDVDSKTESQSEKEVIKFCNEECQKVPPGVSFALAEVIQKYKSEQYNLVTIKKKLKLAAGIHAQILPGVFKILGFPFNSKPALAAGNAAQKALIDQIEAYIENAVKATADRKTRTEAKESKAPAVDPLDEAFLVSGSNPGSQDLLDDANIGTELSSLARIMKPRTIELRRRSLKTEHCLQITIDVGETMTEDTYGGYDDFHNSTDQHEEQGSKGVMHSTPSEDDADNDEGSESESGSESYFRNYKAIGFPEDTKSDTEWKTSYYKIFIENISQELDKDGLVNALRKCGTIAHVEFIKCSSDGPASAALGGEPEPLTAVSLLEKFGIESDARLRTCANGRKRCVLLPKNPLAVITSVKLKPVKKTLVKPVASDLGAFVMMADYEGYRKVTGDDMRIFGICVGGQKSRVVTVETMRTLYLETTACVSAKNIKSFLNVVLGSNQSYEITNTWANNGARRQDKFAQHEVMDSEFSQSKVMPVFVILRFNEHHQAWESHRRILHAIEGGAPFRLAWTKTNWYHSVRTKAREMNVINNMLMEDSEFYVKSWGEQARGKVVEIEDQLYSDDDEALDNFGVKRAPRAIRPPAVLEIDDTIDLMKVDRMPKARRSNKSNNAAQENAARKLARQAIRNNGMFPFPSSSSSPPSRTPDQYYNSDDEQYSSSDKLRA